MCPDFNSDLLLKIFSALEFLWVDHKTENFQLQAYQVL
jgi:hypothetical protein